jgi:hypothetical protein
MALIRMLKYQNNTSTGGYDPIILVKNLKNQPFFSIFVAK